MLSPSLLQAYYQTNYCFGNSILNVDKEFDYILTFNTMT